MLFRISSFLLPLIVGHPTNMFLCLGGETLHVARPNTLTENGKMLFHTICVVIIWGKKIIVQLTDVLVMGLILVITEKCFLLIQACNGKSYMKRKCQTLVQRIKEKKKSSFCVIVGSVASFPISSSASLHHPAWWEGVYVLCIFHFKKGSRGGATPSIWRANGITLERLLGGITDVSPLRQAPVGGLFAVS